MGRQYLWGEEQIPRLRRRRSRAFSSGTSVRASQMLEFKGTRL